MNDLDGVGSTSHAFQSLENRPARLLPRHRIPMAQNRLEHQRSPPKVESTKDGHVESAKRRDKEGHFVLGSVYQVWLFADGSEGAQNRDNRIGSPEEGKENRTKCEKFALDVFSRGPDFLLDPEGVGRDHGEFRDGEAHGEPGELLVGADDDGAEDPEDVVSPDRRVLASQSRHD